MSIPKLAKRAKELGYDSLAITDHGTVAGWVHFAKECKKQGIRPIFGVEAYFTPDRNVRSSRSHNYHLILLAKNNTGIRNLFRITEKAWTEGFYYDPRVDWELLEEHREGVICLSACVSGVVARTYANEGQEDRNYEEAEKYALRFREIFGDDYYLEVQFHNLDIERTGYAGVAKIAANNGIKLVGTNDVHYIYREDADVQTAMVAARRDKTLKEPNIKCETNQLYLKSPEEMAGIFGGFDRQAVVSTVEIANKCTAKLDIGAKPKLPRPPMPKEFDDEMVYLEHLARKGLKGHGKARVKEYEDRIGEELRVIKCLKDKGYAFDRYFLIVHEFVDWARKRDIRVGVGRGSGVGSLLLYCLGITGLDPLPYDLLFERFLHEERTEMPDIDIDFEHDRTIEVYDHVKTLYGENHCARIGTVGVFHAAGAIKAAYRVFDPGNNYEEEQDAKAQSEAQRGHSKHKYSKRAGSPAKKRFNRTAQMADETTKLLPRGPNGTPDTKYALSKDKPDYKPEENKLVYDEVPGIRDKKRQYPEMFRFAERIEGLISSRGVHASGVLITEGPTVDLVPQQVIKERQGGETAATTATAFDMKAVEMLGGIKFDFLSTKVLSVITKAVKTIEKQGRWKFPFTVDHLPVDDKKTLNLFKRGDTLAIFQFEGDGMRKLLRDIKPDCFEDLIAANSLFRPGPMENIPSYISRKKGEEKVEYVHSLLRTVLEPTYGIIVYQEQVIKAVRALAGFSGPDGEVVRKAMGKKIHELLDKMKDKFLDGCAEQKTLSPDQAKRLWKEMEDFASYAFNKSHSAAYSYTAYQCAFLKAYFPAEYMAAQLSVEGLDSKYDTVTKYENGAKAMGIDILPVDINLSRGDYLVEGASRSPALRRGFKGIKGVGRLAYEDIIACQPYRDFMDYCMRAKSGAQSNVVDALIDEGAFDSFKKTLSGMLGRNATKDDLRKDFQDKAARAQNERREKGARKEEKEGIGMIFSIGGDDDIGQGGLAEDFKL